MFRVDDLNQWRGDDVVDDGGDRSGKRDQIDDDAETEEPTLLDVTTGRISYQLAFVPCESGRVGKDRLMTDKATFVVDGAPSIDPDSELPDDLELQLYRDDAVPYVSGSAPSGRRLVRR